MNVLILTIKFGMGHFTAASNIAEQIHSDFPDADILVQDICQYLFPAHSQTIYNTYHLFVTKGSKIYNNLYEHSERVPTKFTSMVPEYTQHKLQTLIEETEPTILISTCSICTQIISAYKKATRDPVPFITYITDITSHPSWITEQTDYYLVATDSVKQGLVAKGIRPDRIFVNGMPIRKEFRSRVCTKKKETNERHLLIMGGGLGMIPKQLSFYKELSKMDDLKITCITGNNHKMQEKLEGKFDNLDVIGYTQKVYRYMQEADLILSKPGGLTLFEAITAEIPLLVCEATLGQEVKNQHFIMRNGIGKVLPNHQKEQVDYIRQLLNDKAALGIMSNNMKKLKKQIDYNGLKKLLLLLEDSPAESSDFQRTLSP